MLEGGGSVCRAGGGVCAGGGGGGAPGHMEEQEDRNDPLKTQHVERTGEGAGEGRGDRW